MDELITLPHRPVLVLEPRKGWVSLDLGAVWAHRELLYFLTWRDIKLRYKQTALGVLWAVVQPVLPMIIFTVLFGRFASMPSDGMPYAAFAFAGLLPWTYVANAIGNSSGSIVASASLVTKVYFPRMIIPGAAVLAALLDFLIGFAVLGVLLAWYRIPLQTSLLIVPVLIAILTVLALGLGMLCAALTVRYRDVRHVLPVLIQFWMFATPIIFPISMVPAKWRWVLVLNPLTGIIENFRAAVFGRPLAWGTLGVSVVFACSVVVYGAYSFRRLERTFADTI